MQVFKFGGASVKDTASIQNVAKIVAMYREEEVLIVISAMGKTTNALEKLTDAYFHQRQKEAMIVFEEVKSYHQAILADLVPDHNHPLHDELANTFVEIDWILEEEPNDDYGFVYDQIVSIGEILSTKIVAGYLKSIGIATSWIDARGYIQTDNSYREAKVDWQKTEENILKSIPQLLQNQLVVTQGFIGGTSENYTTTLGREGSDYTASIFASCLNATSVTIWKDVPGVLNADPKLFNDTHKFEQLPYSEAIEMTYYGATVIHPKTIKPLQNKYIPLLVRPFLSPQEKGTTIGLINQAQYNFPTIIVKKQQVLLSIASHDFSFIAEESLSRIFSIVAAHQVKINLMQNSALSFSICVDGDIHKLPLLIKALQEDFKVKYNENLELWTIRHYTEDFIQKTLHGKELLVEQRSRNTFQVVLK